MFHLELRQRPNVARAFNLEERDLIARFLGPHLAGRTVVYADHEWDPRKLRLTVVEGPVLPPEEMGMGRGWANVSKAGIDVTERMVARAREQTLRPEGLDRLKERLLGRLAAGAIALRDVLSMAEDLMEGHRLSQRLALAELAVWELLHEGAAQLESDRDGSALATEQWAPVLLSTGAWLAEDHAVRLTARLH